MSSPHRPSHRYRPLRQRRRSLSTPVHILWTSGFGTRRLGFGFGAWAARGSTLTIGADDGIVPPATDRTVVQQLWSSAQEELRFQLARPSYETWLATATLVESDGQRFVIGVPTRLARGAGSEARKQR